MVEKEFTDGTYTRLFTGLNTNAEQMTHYKNNLNFVVSYSIVEICVIHIFVDTSESCVGNKSKGQRLGSKASYS